MRRALEVEPINFYYDEKSFQGQGIGQKLLLWGMNHIKEQGYEEIILHVAEWNQNAVKLYLKNGFSIAKRERVR